MKSFSFPPVVNNDAKILILGTMPGKKSLEMKEYYAYKYNVFWKIMFKLFDTGYSGNYDVKKSLLLKNGIALWDVLKYCYREGSADADIKNEIPNDFEIFFSDFTGIKHIFFNGNSAMKFYKKYAGFNENFNFYTLPSTSPANARMSFEEKLSKWYKIKEVLNEK